MKLDLLTNATVVDDAIRFVSEKSKDKEKEQVKSSSSSSSDGSGNEDDKKEESDNNTINQVIYNTTTIGCHLAIDLNNLCFLYHKTIVLLVCRFTSHQ